MRHDVIKEIEKKMNQTIGKLEYELKGLRTSRASVNFLDSIEIEAYGKRMSLSHVSNIFTQDAKTLIIEVWDTNIIKVIEKTILNSNLGVVPLVDKQTIKIVMPLLTEERRKELVKLAYKYSEQNKVALRNIRRDGNEILKKLEKSNEISKDEHRNILEEIQKLTDFYSSKIDQYIKIKEEDIMTI